MKAFIASGTLRVDVSWARSLKEKRSVLRPLVDRFRHRHKTALVRLHGTESHTWEVLGYAFLGSDPAVVEEEARKALRTVEAAEGEFQIIASQVLVDEIDLEPLVRFLPR